jgi:hypothetical protein
MNDPNQKIILTPLSKAIAYTQMNSNYDLPDSSLRQMQGANLQATSLFPKICNAADGVRLKLVSRNLNSFEYILKRPFNNPKMNISAMQ